MSIKVQKFNEPLRVPGAIKYHRERAAARKLQVGEGFIWSHRNDMNVPYGTVSTWKNDNGGVIRIRRRGPNTWVVCYPKTTAARKPRRTKHVR